MSSRISLSKKDYNQDNIFDKFNMKEYLSKPVYIHPCKENDFLYKSSLKTKTNSSVSKNSSNIFNSNSFESSHSNKSKENISISKHDEEIIQAINSNKFGIKIEDLTLRYEKGMTMNFLDVYKPINFIGQGGFGVVISVKKIDTDKTYACKIIKKIYHHFDVTNICNEAPILKNLNHPRIIKLHEVIDTNEYLFLFMDLIEGGTLKEFIIDRYQKALLSETSNNSLSKITNTQNSNNSNSSNSEPSKYFITDEESSIIMRGILEGINYMHTNNIMHRDLKPENIMLKNKNDLNSIVICDFGISVKYHNDQFSSDKCGTLIYMAPEMLQGRPSDQLVDSWACGIILYILESGGRHPIGKFMNDFEKYTALLSNKKFKWEFGNEFPNLARNLFLKLCKPEPYFRYHISKALKHPWITRDEKNDSIPLTLVESYARELKIKNFKSLLVATIYFKIYKNSNSRLFAHKKIKKKILLKDTRHIRKKEKSKPASSEIINEFSIDKGKEISKEKNKIKNKETCKESFIVNCIDKDIDRRKQVFNEKTIDYKDEYSISNSKPINDKCIYPKLIFKTPYKIQSNNNLKSCLIKKNLFAFELNKNTNNDNPTKVTAKNLSNRKLENLNNYTNNNMSTNNDNIYAKINPSKSSNNLFQINSNAYNFMEKKHIKSFNSSMSLKKEYSFHFPDKRFSDRSLNDIMHPNFNLCLVKRNKQKNLTHSFENINLENNIKNVNTFEANISNQLFTRNRKIKIFINSNLKMGKKDNSDTRLKLIKNKISFCEERSKDELKNNFRMYKNNCSNTSHQYTTNNNSNNTTVINNNDLHRKKTIKFPTMFS